MCSAYLRTGQMSAKYERLYKSHKTTVFITLGAFNTAIQVVDLILTSTWPLNLH